jgi:hypothetical protein
MIEAPQKVDQFDAHIPGESVIVYRVQTSDPLGHAQNGTALVELLTTTPLGPGAVFTTDGGVSVRITGALPGGFSVNVDDPTNAVAIVPDVFGEPAEVAANDIVSAGLVPEFTGSGSWVFRQSPAAGRVAPGG